MATVSKWTPYGVALDVTATAGTVTRTSATQFTVKINASWETYYSGANTTYGMKASSGGQTVTLSAYNSKGNSSGSGTLTGTYSISGNGAATKTITVTFTNFNYDDTSKSTTINLSVSVPAWTSYTVTYNANGGTGAPASQTKWKNQTLTLSSTKPTRTGYSFQGWALSKADADAGTWYYAAGGTCGKNENLTLYAVWKANTYSVTYNANGGTGAPAKQTKTYGKTLTLSTTKPTRTNYNFLGWAESASATTVKYKSGASYTANAAVTLYAVWELAYVKPSVDITSLTRSEDGKTVTVEFSWTSTYEAISAQVSWKSNAAGAIGAGLYNIDLKGTLAATTRSYSYTFPEELDPETTYTIVVTLSDSGGSNSASATLHGTLFTIDCKAGGKGVAFGKAAEMENYADFGFEICMNNSLRISARDLEGNIVEAFQPVNENGNTVIGWGNYNKQAGYTNVYGHDVHYGVSNIANPGTFRPYRRQGDTLTFTIRTAGYVTNSGKDVSFLVPFAVPIVGAPTVSVTSLNGFTLRQDTKYTHGSSASVFCVPDSYTAQVAMWCGVYVTAHFTDVTNVVNNSSIGVYWNGTITFT